MKRIYLLFVVVILAACSADPLENEVLSGLDANLETKSKKGSSQDFAESFEVPELICKGEEAVFTFIFEDKPGKTNLKVQLEGDDPETEEVEDWYNIFNEQVDGGGPEYFNFTFEEAGLYNIRYFIGGGGHTEISVLVENCGCEESFTYFDNGDQTYTFTYIPEEDWAGAELVFTFAQSVDLEGLSGWDGNGQTRKMVMNLQACTTYSWTVTLKANCSGKSGHSNVWTDFKINDVSKKTDKEHKFVQTCS